MKLKNLESATLKEDHEPHGVVVILKSADYSVRLQGFSQAVYAALKLLFGPKPVSRSDLDAAMMRGTKGSHQRGPIDPIRSAVRRAAERVTDSDKRIQAARKRLCSEFMAAFDDREGTIWLKLPHAKGNGELCTGDWPITIADPKLQSEPVSADSAEVSLLALDDESSVAFPTAGPLTSIESLPSAPMDPVVPQVSCQDASVTLKEVSNFDGVVMMEGIVQFGKRRLTLPQFIVVSDAGREFQVQFSAQSNRQYAYAGPGPAPAGGESAQAVSETASTGAGEAPAAFEGGCYVFTKSTGIKTFQATEKIVLALILSKLTKP